MGGDNGGEKGEGFSGTTVKDTWTKPSGVWNQEREVGMAGVGGKADNVLEQQ